MSSATRTTRLTLILCTGVVVICWVLGAPRWAGADEPSHAIASAALVRGHMDGPIADIPYWAEIFEVPSMVGDPDPGCFYQQPDVPASCAGEPADSAEHVVRYSTASNYPIWGHLLPGIASFVPSPHWFAYLARLANAAPAIAIVAGALLRSRRSPWLFIGLLLGLTPIAWFSMAIISPSALAIAGGAALWSALLTPTERRNDILLLAGWLALALARRDGPLWATLVVLAACAATETLPSELWQRRSIVERVVIVITALLGLLPTITNGVDRLNTVLVFAPLLLIVADLAARTHRRRAKPVSIRLLALVAGGCAALAVGAANVLRPGGPDITMTLKILTGTGRHLRQLVGLLGWLDTPVPESLLLLWWMAFGALAALAILSSPRQATVAAAAFATMLVTSWVLEIGTGDPSGTYWQGRYSMPLMLGVPMMLGRTIEVDVVRAQLLRVTIARVAWVIWNFSFAAALRRWGVGINGSVYPWRWNTWHAPAAPMLLLAAHAIASWLLIAERASLRRADQP